MFLESPVFMRRYIEPNISWYVNYFRGNRGVARVWREPTSWILKKFFLKSYFQKRVAQGKVDIPSLAHYWRRAFDV
ncbi:hypothetical protein [Helicobacter winghamensis]|uniref:hypothetical protein n=1 Tax=Helicobacter winghamensis TaxID=157268 RepID=UPI00351B7139